MGGLGRRHSPVQSLCGQASVWSGAGAGMVSVTAATPGSCPEQCPRMLLEGVGGVVGGVGGVGGGRRVGGGVGGVGGGVGGGGGGVGGGVGGVGGVGGGVGRRRRRRRREGGVARRRQLGTLCRRGVGGGATTSSPRVDMPSRPPWVSCICRPTRALAGRGNAVRLLRWLTYTRTAYPASVPLRGFKYRFYPTAEQEVLLRRTIGCCRLV
jgi:hypothetical protein